MLSMMQMKSNRVAIGLLGFLIVAWLSIHTLILNGVFQFVWKVAHKLVEAIG